MKKLKLWFLVIALAISLIWILVDIGIYNELDEKNATLAHNMQSGGSPSADQFFIVMSYFFDGRTVVPIVLVL